jgi:hypothetical protein
MQRKCILSFLLVLFTILAIGIPAVSSAATVADYPYVTKLIAGQNIEVGCVAIANSGGKIYVRLQTTGGWVMTDVHLAIGAVLADIPQTRMAIPFPASSPSTRPSTPR